jgi:NADH pyrophosphatase NudC (nudix superfamily)
VTAEELAKLFETAGERLGILMSSIADPAKLQGYAEGVRLCQTLAMSIRIAAVDEAEFASTLAQLVDEMERARFCIHCGQKLTYGLGRCPNCGKRVIEP